MTGIPNAAPITSRDKVSDVLARDESLVEVFVRHAPHFTKLRNRAMRRVMARLVTVEQAARTANVPADRLVSDLNAALGIAIAPVPADSDVQPSVPDAPAATTRARRPVSATTVEVDVRDDLRSGREPFSRIMSTVAALADGEVLHLRAPFEPVPLFDVLGKRGFAHESLAHAPDDWSAWFWRSETGVEAASPAASDASPAAQPARNTGATDRTTVWLDVRGLEPPEPLMRTLAALEELPSGHTLIQVNSRVPQLLFPVLVEQGFACEVDDSDPESILVRIWHAR